MIAEPRRGLRARCAVEDRPVARLRGLSVAVLTVSLALAAHAAGGGAVPTASGIVMLLLAGAAAGWAAGPAVGRCGHRCGRAAVIGALLIGQGAGHLLLSLAGGRHHGAAIHGPAHIAGDGAMAHMPPGAVHHAPSAPDLPLPASIHDALATLLQTAAGHGGPGMLAAHVAATVVCAGLLIVAEALYGPLATAFRRLVPPPPRMPAVIACPAPARPDGPDPRAASVPLTPLTRRGPPRSTPVRPGATPAPA